MGDLFMWGVAAPLHSGEMSQLKIDCDALSSRSVDTLAEMMRQVLPRFGRVIGIPQGGLRLARALESYVSPEARLLVIVDDVLTTGASMEGMRETCEGPCVGIVVFARRPGPEWVHSLFRMNEHAA